MEFYNDLIPFSILLLANFIIFIAAIIWHELGHGLSMLRKNEKYIVKINFNMLSLNYSSSKIDIITIWSGILFGLFPILIGTLVIGNNYISLLFIPYLIGCSHDFNELEKLS